MHTCDYPLRPLSTGSIIQHILPTSGSSISSRILHAAPARPPWLGLAWPQPAVGSGSRAVAVRAVLRQPGGRRARHPPSGRLPTVQHYLRPLWSVSESAEPSSAVSRLHPRSDEDAQVRPFSSPAASTALPQFHIPHSAVATSTQLIIAPAIITPRRDESSTAAPGSAWPIEGISPQSLRARSPAPTRPLHHHPT